MIGQQRWVTGQKTPPKLPPAVMVFSLLTRAIVGGVLIYSGASKALAPSAEFAAALAAYRVLPAAVIPWIAQYWPWVELLVGTYVFFGYFTRLFAGAAAGMFAIFLAVLGSALARGIDPGSCGCFGIGLTFSPHKMLVFDAGFLVFSLLLAVAHKHPSPLSADGWISK